KAARWHAGLHQPAALLQNIVLTVAHTVGVGPVFLNTPDFHVGTRHYGKIDRVVDLDQARPELASKRYRRLIRRLFATLLRNAPAKLVVTYRLGRRPRYMHEGRCCLCRFTPPPKHKRDRNRVQHKDFVAHRIVSPFGETMTKMDLICAKFHLEFLVKYNYSFNICY